MGAYVRWYTENEELNMSDDILTKLRDLAYIVVNSENRAQVVMLSGDILSQAADEIERLRAEIVRLNSLLHPEGMSAIEKVECLHEQIVRIVKGYND